MTRSGSTVVLAGLVLASGCAPKTRGRPFAIPVPLQLQNVVAVDKQGNRILAGSFAGKLQIAGGELASAGGTDIFIAKADKAGKPVFPPQRFGGKGDDAATGVAVDDDGSIVLAGTFQGEAVFGEQRLKAEVRHEGQRAVFVARLDPAGKVVWVKQIAVANLPTQVSVAVGPDHNIVVGATATGTIAKEDKAGGTGWPKRHAAAALSDGRTDTAAPVPNSWRDRSRWDALILRAGQAACLVPGCGPDECIAWICSVDPYCCSSCMGLDLRRRGRFRLPAPMRLRPASASRATRSIPTHAIARPTFTAWIPTAERRTGTRSVSARLAVSAAPPAPRASVTAS